MIYTLFFSRLRDLSPDLQAAYGGRSQQLFERATERYPGFVDIKSFVAEDWERLSVVRFRDEESQRAWKLDSVHQESQGEGRSDFYERYRVAVCEEVRSYGWLGDDLEEDRGGEG